MNLDNHPCFNPEACNSFGRVHLPVAPRCNIQCKFCNRRFDCVNETRPGVTSAVLSPAQAMVYLEEVIERKGNIAVVGIAGPGDPFANPKETLETLARVRARFPEVILCVATNGLNLPPHLDDLARLQVSHVTVTVNAVDPAVGAKIYSWMRVGKKVVRAEEGAALLLARQQEAIEGLRSRGIMVKVNSIILPG
ncbi:MAG: radical SAM protein, partial [Desulfobacterales bacterium]|nr:radical SAM protein [Desulfobacterales bacterium]